MADKRKMNPQARGVYITCLIIAEIIGFNLFHTDSVFGAALIGGGAAFTAWFTSKLIIEARGMDFYVQPLEDKSLGRTVNISQVDNDDELESWEVVKNGKRN